MDLNSMSLGELRRLQTRVASEIQRRGDNARKTLLKKMKKMIEDEGLSFSDVMSEITEADSKPAKQPRKRGPKPVLKKGAKLPHKYFNPENPAMGWSGHGRKPQWIIDWLAQDKPLSELEKGSTQASTETDQN
jgi:DNA-binding protein H-NS